MLHLSCKSFTYEVSAFDSAFAESQEEFHTEEREKQEILDQINTKVRDSSSLLSEDRRRLEELQKRAAESTELDQKVSNLRRSAAELRNKLSQPNGHAGGGSRRHIMENITIGEADKGLDANGTIGKIDELFPTDINFPVDSDEQAACLASLERPEVLSARVNAYRRHNETLEARARQLKSRSSELEERYRKMVSLCTGVKQEKVDEMLGPMSTAVVSEQMSHTQAPSDLGRVRNFMRMLQEVEV